jgi:hypothetical protein
MRIRQFNFLKIILLLAVLCGISYLCNKVINGIKSQREMNARINPAIFPAFRRIENFAYEYVMKEKVNRKEYDRCKEFIRVFEEEEEREMRIKDYSRQDATQWYAFLEGLGFELPLLYLEKEATKEQREKAEKEQLELERKGYEIFDKYLKYLLNKSNIKDAKKAE